MLGQPIEAQGGARDVLPVEQILAHQDVHHRQGQGAVGAGPDHQVLVGLLRRRRAVGIDDDDVRAAGPRLLHQRHHVDRRVGGVDPPQHHQVGAHHLLGVVAADHAQRGPPSRVGGGDADRAVELAGAQRVEERVPGVVLHLPHGAGVGERQDRLGPVGRDDLPPAPGDLRHRVVPGDRLEASLPLGPDAAQGPRDPQRRVHALAVLAHLAADHALGEAVLGIARDRDEAAVLDVHLEAAAGRAVVRTD